MSPIQPVPVDQPATPGGFPDPRYWQYPVGYNLPTQPGTEGFKLASFSQLQTIASKYNVARRAIELRKEEIAGLEWSIELTTKAAKAYQGDHKAMRDFGERAAQATRFFKHPDPDYFDFGSFLKALLEEILVYDALCLVFRPKYGQGLGRGLLGSDLDSLSLVSGPTIRPLLNMHGGKPRPPAPAYQQFLYGVPAATTRRSSPAPTSTTTGLPARKSTSSARTRCCIFRWCRAASRHTASPPLSRHFSRL